MLGLEHTPNKIAGVASFHMFVHIHIHWHSAEVFFFLNVLFTVNIIETEEKNQRKKLLMNLTKSRHIYRYSGLPPHEGNWIFLNNTEKRRLVFFL